MHPILEQKFFLHYYFHSRIGGLERLFHSMYVQQSSLMIEQKRQKSSECSWTSQSLSLSFRMKSTCHWYPLCLRVS